MKGDWNCSRGIRDERNNGFLVNITYSARRQDEQSYRVWETPNNPDIR